MLHTTDQRYQTRAQQGLDLLATRSIPHDTLTQRIGAPISGGKAKKRYRQDETCLDQNLFSPAEFHQATETPIC